MLNNSCSLTNWCQPSPCKNGGLCKQTYDNPYCDCRGTDYVGAVCGASLHWNSCQQLLEASRVDPGVVLNDFIDFDGYGTIPPVRVNCELSNQGEYITSINHSNEESTKVDGFQEPGSFNQIVHYDIAEEAINQLLQMSERCSQSLSYSCKKSRLFSSHYNDTFVPYGWWVSWKNSRMDYWAGAIPGSWMCSCGTNRECHDTSKRCNCDSEFDGWLQDGGEITIKDHLPVRALHFGDTGTALDNKEGRFNLGMLRCKGDRRYEVEFGPIQLKRFSKKRKYFSHELNLSLEFRTNLSISANLVYETVNDIYLSRVILVGAKTIVYEWSSPESVSNITVTTKNNLKTQFKML